MQNTVPPIPPPGTHPRWQAPQLYEQVMMEIKMRELQAAQHNMTARSPSSAGAPRGAPKKKKSNQTKYDVLGWGVLVVAVVAIVAFASANQ